MKDKIYVTPDETLVINGQEYILGNSLYRDINGIAHVKKTRFKKFNRNAFNKKVDFIVNKIQGKLVKEELIKELVFKIGQNEVDNIYKTLKSGKKKIEKQDGCVGIKIGSGYPKTGGRYFQLID